MQKIEHIGIAVKDLKISNPLFEKLLGTPCYKEEEVKSEGVKTSFFKTGPNKIELLEATNEDSPIAKFIEKKGIIMALDKELVECLQWYFTHAEGKGIEERKQDSKKNRLMAKQLGGFIRELGIPGTFAVGVKHNIDEDYENELVTTNSISP